MSMQEDRFFSAWQKIQLRVSTLTDAFDYTLLYPARIIEWEASGIFPSGIVGVVFVSDDVGKAATKLKSKKGIPVLPPVVGQSYVPKVGSQVLVGWQGGDERFPYVTGWLGLGGAESVAHDFDTSYTFTGDLVDVVGDIQFQHIRLGGSSASPTVQINPTFAAVIGALTVTGSDAFFKVDFTFTPNMVITQLNPGDAVVLLTFKKSYLAAPLVSPAAGSQLTLTTITTVGASVTPIEAITMGGAVTGTILTADPS